jgi:hypothetical protein
MANEKRRLMTRADQASKSRLQSLDQRGDHKNALHWEGMG